MHMKKYIYLVLMLCLSISAQAITVIVMDTTQALLPEAKVKVGSKVLSTSFDGKVEFDKAALPWTKRITITCDGYNKQRVKVDPSKELILISLVPNKPKANREYSGKVRPTSHAPEDGIYYSLTSARGSAKESKILADMVVMEEAEFMPPMSGAMPNNVSAGKLTAGEVNDFAKWSFWNTYLQSTASYQKTWGIVPRYRYTVQATNKNGYPIPNYTINLTDVNGNTLFQTVTDNTGKAELWGDVMAKGRKANGEWKEGLNTIVLDEPCDYSDVVDVCFIFDATGSMGDELAYLQAEMKDVIARAKDATGGLTIRTGAVVYRDHGDDYITRISRMTTDIATTQAFIDKQEADGGGDYPEAVPEALMAALNSAGWDENARARIAFLILDAPCHDDSATLALMHDQILNSAAQGIRIVPVVCSGIEASTEYLLRTIALVTNGTSFFLTDDSGIGNPHHKPTVDSLKVEHLNDMLVRTIVEFSMMPNCAGHWSEEAKNAEGEFVPNPFEIKDLTPEQITEKDSRTTLYLLDISGKLIYIYEGRLEDASDSQIGRLPLPMLSTGVYFVKAFYDGEWHTKKILIH